MLTRKAMFPGLILVFSSGLALGGEVIANWPAPAFWSPSRATQGARTQADITSPLPFIGVTPCRQYDSRNTTPLPQNTAREVVITGAPCGIPAAADAVSLNVTVFNILGQTGNAVLQVGTTNNPTTAWINYPIGQGQIGNAGVLPLSGAQSIFFRVQQGGGSIDFTIDVNGYYSGYPASGQPFVLSLNNSGGATMLLNNASTTCVLYCGLYQSVHGVNSWAITGEAYGTGAGIGIFGVSHTSEYASAGVWGQAVSSTGATFGVVGIELSPAFNSAGVKGFDASGAPANALNYFPAGVRGDSASAYGVLGVSRTQGVAGSVVSAVPTELAWGVLGFNPGTVYGVYSGGNFGGSGAKYFVEPHPTDASKVIRYVSLEGPESGTYFRGRGRFQDGLATIEAPEDFRMVTDPEGLSVQVTPIREFANVAVVQIGLEGIVVKASRDVEFFYTVNGVRRTHRDLKPIGPGNEFMPASADAKMPAYLTEGQKAMLVSNGTYKEDGTVNLETAERVGWVKAWKDREEHAKAAAAAGRAASDR